MPDAETTLTFAPTMGLPDSSVTFPLIVPRLCCPQAIATENSKNKPNVLIIASYGRITVPSRHQALNHILQAFAHCCRLRPWAGLPQDVQLAALIQHVEMAVFSFAIKTAAGHRFRHVQVAQSDFRKPVRQVRVQ